MSLQWTFIATFLYTEIFLVGLLLLPFISAARWQKIFRSRLLNAFRSYANLYFNVFIVILVILFFDAIRDVMKYSEPKEDALDLKTAPGAEIALNMKLFRAQRNFYIAGFSLFLCLVLRRLVTLLSREAQMEADNSAIKKQAESASVLAKQLMEEKDAAKQNKDNEKNTEGEEKLKSALEELTQLKQELKKSNTNLDAMKSQAESTNKAHDMLLDEHRKLQDQLDKMEGREGVKKEE